MLLSHGDATAKCLCVCVGPPSFPGAPAPGRDRCFTGAFHSGQRQRLMQAAETWRGNGKDADSSRTRVHLPFPKLPLPALSPARLLLTRGFSSSRKFSSGALTARLTGTVTKTSRGAGRKAAESMDGIALMLTSAHSSILPATRWQNQHEATHHVGRFRPSRVRCISGGQVPQW